MTIQTITAPVYEPVSRAEAKDWCRIEASNTSHDAVIDMLIQSMREDVENLTHRAFIQRTLKLTLSDWPQDSDFGPTIELPFPPLISVSSFQYRDADGVLQTLATSQYVVHTWREPAWIVPEWEVTWPTIRILPDALQITYVAGYSPGSPPDEQGSQDALPAKLKLWMQARLVTIFENREQLIVNNQVQIPRNFADGLLDSLVVGTRLF